VTDGQLAEKKPEQQADAVITTMQLVAEAGITYRQADYWARTGLLRPRIGQERGRGQGGVYREWDAEEVRVARLMGRLTAASLSPSVAAVLARKWPEMQEIAPGIWVQIDEEALGAV
jgi:DNA-binding transcriptional MerR regulator